jgi:hypothetical protein
MPSGTPPPPRQRRRFRQHILFRRRGDEGAEQRGGALALELGVVIGVHDGGADDRRQRVRDAPDLAGLERPEDVHDLLGRHGGDLAGEADRAGMLAVEAIGQRLPIGPKTMPLRTVGHCRGRCCRPG